MLFYKLELSKNYNIINSEWQYHNISHMAFKKSKTAKKL